MKRLEYLKKAIEYKLYRKKAWFLSAFALIKEDPEAWRTRLQDPYYRLVQTPTGHYATDAEAKNLIPIEDAVVGSPVFTFSESIVIDSTWHPGITESIPTTIGNLLFNLICIIEVFNGKIPYMTGTVRVGKIEDLIASRLQDTPPPKTERSTDYIYVDEYVEFVDRLQFIQGLSQLCVYAATPKNMTSPPGIVEFKQSLDVKYGDTINDPSILAQYEGELKAYDEAYLKDDPSNGKFLSGKIKDIGRKKMFLTIGSEMAFEASPTVVPIRNSLEQGWPTDPIEFTAMMNSIRIGSFSRGSETVKGGVMAKILLRALGNHLVVDTDCQTEMGIRRSFTSSNVNELVGVSIWLDGSWTLIPTIEVARTHLGEPLLVRSPMYCRLEGDRICKHCAGELLATNPSGIPAAVADKAGIVLNAFMKAMHGKKLSTAKYDFNQALS